ncbi:hypothetical protein EC849_108130 [Pseudomonas putida]|nr:hypothetical protein EC849_108130 [Pseudomonas putida]
MGKFSQGKATQSVDAPASASYWRSHVDTTDTMEMTLPNHRLKYDAF